MVVMKFCERSFIEMIESSVVFLFWPVSCYILRKNAY